MMFVEVVKCEGSWSPRGLCGRGTRRIVTGDRAFLKECYRDMRRTALHYSLTFCLVFAIFSGHGMGSVGVAAAGAGQAVLAVASEGAL